MNDMLLVYPSEDMAQDAVDFKNEFLLHDEKTIYGSNRLDMDKYTCAEWLTLVNGLNESPVDLEKGFSHTLFAIRGDGQPIGIVNIRHPLTGRFENAGHIGYSVRPTERRKGYATTLLRRTLLYAKKLGLTEVLLVCKKDNEASQKTILRNGGTLRRVFTNNEAAYEEYQIVL